MRLRGINHLLCCKLHLFTSRNVRCLPSPLTGRLVQELTKNEIDVDNIIVNQILFPQKGDALSPCLLFFRHVSHSSSDTNCDFCLARVKMQGKYLAQINDLYQDFHVIKLPLQKSEVRGKAKITCVSFPLTPPTLFSPPRPSSLIHSEFSKNMMESYQEKYDAM